MAVRYFVETSSNVLKSATDFDLEPTPAGHTAVLRSTIAAVWDEAILIGGTWDGTDYEPPDGYVSPPDPTTTVGQLVIAARTLHDFYISLQERLESNEARYFLALHREWAHDFVAMLHRGTRGVFLSTVYTSAEKLAWALAQAMGPTDVPSDEPSTFFVVVEDWTASNALTNVPTSRVVFANPADASRWKLDESVAMTADLTGLAAETTDFTDYHEGKWIDEITA